MENINTIETVESIAEAMREGLGHKTLIADLSEGSEGSEGISPLESSAKLKDVIAKINEIIEFVNNAKPTKVRDRGPDSTREMTEDDARRALLGDLADKSHKDVAKELGLSYGQIYSARKGFTFKGVYKEFRDMNK